MAVFRNLAIISRNRFFSTFQRFLRQDRYSELKKSDFLIVRHDNNCGYRYKERFYSPILDSVIDAGNNMGLSFVTVAKPFSQHGKDSAYNDPLIFNRDFFFAFSVSKLISFFVGKEKYAKIRCFYEKKVWTRIIREIEPSSVIAIQPRSEERRVGKECRSRWSRYQ